jgi:hypothetical protein
VYRWRFEVGSCWDLPGPQTKDRAEWPPQRKGIPTGLLIDQKGVIIWKGHPTGYDIVVQVDKLLGEPE